MPGNPWPEEFFSRLTSELRNSVEDSLGGAYRDGQSQLGDSSIQGPWAFKGGEHPRVVLGQPETCWRTRTQNPKDSAELLRLFLGNNLARQSITSENKNNLARLFFMLVLKGIWGGSQKIATENKNTVKLKNDYVLGLLFARYLP